MLTLASLVLAVVPSETPRPEPPCCGGRIVAESNPVPTPSGPEESVVHGLAPLEGHPELWALEWRVDDPTITGALLASAFGFEPETLQGREAAIWSLDGFRVVLRKRTPGSGVEGMVHDDSIQLNLEVADLANAMDRARRAGLRVEGIERSPIGEQAVVRLPEGQRIDLMTLDPGYEALSKRMGNELGIFCVSVLVNDVHGARATWASLGWGGEPFPSDEVIVPMEGPGQVQVVLHGVSGPNAPGTQGPSQVLLLFATDDLAPWQDSERSPGRVFSTPVGRSLTLVGESEVPLRLVERSEAQRAFERIRALEGVWEGKSTAGWHAECEYQVIAGGSVVAERTNFEAHPGDTMMTLFHMDDGRLLLTHYCVAGNQPRLVATGFRAGGSEVNFEFLDGTNLPSRDHGHMDAVRFRFPSPNRLHSRWSWYQDGAEGWMEEIELRRARTDPESSDEDSGRR